MLILKPSMFNNPWAISFKDVLALVFSVPFLVTILLFMWKHDASDLDLIKTLIPVIIVVLGGYFGQEVASSYFTRGNTGYGMYGGYYSGYGTYNTGVVTNTVQTNTSTQESNLAGPL